MKTLKKYCVAASCFVAAVTGPVAAETVAITGGTVHTLGSTGTLQNATVLIKDGIIEAVGTNVSIPADASVIDAKGQIVAPGFMHPDSILGLSEVSAVAHTNAHNASDSVFGAVFDVSYGLNYRSVVIADNRRNGVTHAVSNPSGADGMFLGSGAFISLSSAPDMMVDKGPMVLDISEGGNRSVAWARLRRILDDVKDYKRNRSAVQKGKGRTDYLLSAINMDALIPVVDGKQILAMRLDGEVDIRHALKLKEDYDLDVVLVGASEAWRVADELVAADVAVVIDPQDNLPTSFDVVWASRSNAAKLKAAGVKFAMAPAGSGNNHTAGNIGQVAAMAVAHGLDWETAMQAITVVPAEIFGFKGYGALEAGNVANIAIWDGDPLQVTSNTTHVLVNGEDKPLVSRRTLLRDKYLGK
ncbi:MAG: amidohydrolase family protein [Kordiimonas sp.]